jgi:hypothetical protein
MIEHHPRIASRNATGSFIKANSNSLVSEVVCIDLIRPEQGVAKIHAQVFRSAFKVNHLGSFLKRAA